MALVSFRCSDFRCLESAELSLSPGHNLIAGPNASGKTSILEAIAYLGRARSFRGASTREITRHGAEAFMVTGKATLGAREISLGVRNSSAGLEVRARGEKCTSAAPLAESLPLQVIDPDVHGLIASGPEGRRRFIDWLAFHVEQSYLEDWRRFRRALKQRNAALKSTPGAAGLAGWNQELAELGERVDRTRKRVIEITAPALQSFGEILLGSEVDMVYQQGWAADVSLGEALRDAAERDRQLGSTQVGPHRGDLRMVYDERQARKLVSRGQQKLLACAMILAATDVVQRHLKQPLLLLLDDPSAELDKDSVSLLMECVEGLGSQVIATTLDPGQGLFSEPPRLFHVEQGQVREAT